ncbi:MAG: glycoside hydrolase family 1 protein [Deltaproteobacteria bacterium]|nr:glycoside hydrolase family 1 protein [Deltaproteobacteria bacterium]
MIQSPRALALVAPYLFACSSPSLPETFRFGTAIAGFQVEMGCPTIAAEVCEDRGSDWYEFVTSTVTRARDGNFITGGPPSTGPGYYELYESDIGRAKDLGMDIFRFGFEWSRIFPGATFGLTGPDLKAAASPDALAYYHEQLDALKTVGLTPLATVNHYTLPAWIHDAVGCNTSLDRCTRRGWLDPRIVEELAKFAGFLGQEFGSDIELWATQNEPMAVVLPGFMQPTKTRSNPPSVSFRFQEAKEVMLRMILAHARMYDAIHATDAEARVGIVYAVAPVHPADPSSTIDQLGATNVDYLFNRVFLDAVALGRSDPELDGTAVTDEELTGRMDWLGVNYYTRIVVRGSAEAAFPELSPLSTFDPLSLQQGEIYPEGLYEALTTTHARYPTQALIVTENGADSKSTDSVVFLDSHLKSLIRAIDEGEVPVEAYLWWSLIDNYEWNLGMQMRFGLFGVEPEDPTKARVKKPVAARYSELAAGLRDGSLELY